MGQIWETRPLEFWKKAKELRAQWQNTDNSEKILGQGNLYFCDWQSAFPAIRIMEDNPAGAMLSNKNPPYARKSRLACEIRGWGREICGYHNNCWGGQFLGYDEDGGPFPYRKFVIPFPCVCDSHAKRGQQVRDFAPVPQWMDDLCMYLGPRDEKRDESFQDHRAYCTLKEINDIERIFGQKFDDERAMEIFRGEKIMHQYGREIFEIMATTIPTPLSVKDLYSVYTIGFLTRVDPDETLKFWKMVRDEVRWRADNHIAAVANERFRWIEAHPPSWHFLKYYRYMEKYGAVCLGSQYAHGICGDELRLGPDGKIIYNDKLEYPPDTKVVTREDEVRVWKTPDGREPKHFKVDEYNYHDQLTIFAKAMQADGAILGLWRSGVGCTMTRKEQAMLLRQAGINVLMYEGSQPGDRTDMDEKRFIDQLDNWMESMGLRKLVD